jgi:hypothetical protein
MRHELEVILGMAVCAVLAGARSFTAIAEWAADADDHILARLRVTGAVPCESTIHGPCSGWMLMPSMTWLAPGRKNVPGQGWGAADDRGERQDLTRLR